MPSPTTKARLYRAFPGSSSNTPALGQVPNIFAIGDLVENRPELTPVAKAGARTTRRSARPLRDGRSAAGRGEEGGDAGLQGRLAGAAPARGAGGGGVRCLGGGHGVGQRFGKWCLLLFQIGS